MTFKTLHTKIKIEPHQSTVTERNGGKHIERILLWFVFIAKLLLIVVPLLGLWLIKTRRNLLVLSLIYVSYKNVYNAQLKVCIVHMEHLACVTLNLIHKYFLISKTCLIKISRFLKFHIKDFPGIFKHAVLNIDFYFSKFEKIYDVN
jgi:hypothetical protein